MDAPPPRRLFSATSLDREVREELDFHLEGRVRELVERGWSEPEARREARRRFGNHERIADQCVRVRREAARRETRRGGMEALRHDIRLAVRELVRDRGLAALVILTLGLGIGFATALFSLVDGVLLRPLPYPDASRLVYVWQNDRATGTLREQAGTADFYDFRDRSRSFAGLSMWGTYSASLLRGNAEPLHVNVVTAHHDLASVLGVEPVLGRFITPEETEGGGSPVAVLTNRFWRSAFDASPDVLGETVALDGHPTQIVGVLPAGADVVMGGSTDVWTPFRMTAAQATRNPHYATVVGRLGDGVPLERARSEMTRIAAALEQEVPANANRGAFVEPATDFLRGDVSRMLWALFGSVGVLLLLATLNVTNLLLARATARSRESAVHTALGAGGLRTARRNLAVTLLLSVGAGVLGVGVAWVALRVTLVMVPPQLLVLGTPGLDARVLFFALTLVVGLALVFGIAPTVSALRLDLQRALSQGRGDGSGGRSGATLRRLLVMAQAGLAALLLVGAVLLGTTLRNLNHVDPGFRTDHTLRLTFFPPTDRYPVDFSVYPHLDERLELEREILARVGDLPGVESVALASNHPLDPGFTNSFSIEGRPPDPEQGEMTTRMVTPGYFGVAGVELLQGRLPRADEGVDQPGVVVLNATAAQRYFPDGDALGSHLGFWGTGFREIVGIVADEHVQGLRADAPPTFYTSLLQTPPAGGPLTVLVRTRGAPLEMAPAVRRAIWSYDSRLALYDVTTMDATLARATQRERLATLTLGVFASMALILAGLGVYGLLSYTVARRTRELGIRLALGADRASVRRMVIRQGAGLVAVGLLAGLLLARVLTRGLGDLLFGVGTGAPRAYVASGLALLGVAVVAAAIPALRASSVEPAESLRVE